MRLLWAFLLLLCSASWAGTHFADVLTDWAGSPGDTATVDTNQWKLDSLAIAVDSVVFMQALDTALNTIQGGINFGATPLVGVGTGGMFRVLFLQYPQTAITDPANNYLYVASADLFNQTLGITDVAGINIFSGSSFYAQHYYGFSPPDVRASVPSFMDFYSDDSRWAGQWSNDLTSYGPSSRANSSFIVPTGQDFANLNVLMAPGSCALPCAPVSVGSIKSYEYLRGAHYGVDPIYLRMSFAPLNNTFNQFVTIHSPHGPYDNTTNNIQKIKMRWEQLSPSLILALDSFDVPALKGLYHVNVAADTATQHAVMGYTDATGATLKLQAYDKPSGGAVARFSGQYTVVNSLDSKASFTDTMSRNFNLRSLGSDYFLLVYGSGNRIHATTLHINSGSGVVFDSDTIVSPIGINCQFPDLSVNANYVGIAYMRTDAGAIRPEILRFKRNGNALLNDIANPAFVQAYQGPALTFATIASGIPGGSVPHVKALHMPGRASVAIDTNGNAALAFNQERNARLVGYRDRKIYSPTADWTSKPFALSAFPLLVGDSVHFTSATTTPANPTKVQVQLLRSGVVLAPAGSANAYDATGAFHYTLTLSRIDSFKTPAVASTNINWNIQPRKPSINFIRVGAATNPMQIFDSNTTYDVINRKDTVRLFCSAWDLDNPASLIYHVRTTSVSPRNGVAQVYVYSKDSTLVNSANNSSYTFEVVIPPLTLEADLLALSVYTDDGSWGSPRVPVNLRYHDLYPTEGMRILWKNGVGILKDSAVVDGNAVRVQMNDSALVKVGVLDGNDATLQLSWVIHNSRGTIKTGLATVPSGDTAQIRIPWDHLDRDPRVILGPDAIKLVIDTLTVTITDPDTSYMRQLAFIPNHLPQLDSISITGIERQGVFNDTLLGRWRASQAQIPLLVIPATPLRLEHHSREVDQVNGDQFQYQWDILLQDPVQKSQWNTALRTVGDTLIYAFPDNAVKQLARIRATVTDLSGATHSDTINVVFPRVDTVGGWEISMTYLQDSLRFVIGVGTMTAKRDVGIRNIGSLNLDILSVHTGQDQGAWLDYQLVWGNMPPVQDNTQLSRITAPISIPSGGEIPIRFSVDVSNMRGDRMIFDTLYIATSDVLSPLIKIPFAVRWDDLPQMTIMTRPSTGNTAVPPIPLAPYFETNHSLLFVFSEPVQSSGIATGLKVYSRLDSLARKVPGITPMESAFPNILDVRPYRQNGSIVAGLTDTVVFTPLYQTASDYFDLKPLPYNFVRNDVIGIWASNQIVDTTGNPLDLRGTHQYMSPGTFDTIIQAHVDTTALRVVQTWPENGGTLDPDDMIRILFSKPLVQSILSGPDTIRTLDIQTLKGDSNQFIRIRSRFSQWAPTDFRLISLESGDSMLVMRPRYKFLSDDSVEVWISPYLASPFGHTLDGNNDGFTHWPPDSADAYRFRFVLGPTAFYVFPNPYKESNAEHRERGVVTFKNLHQIKGLTLAKDIDICIYTVDGTLVFSTKRSGNSYQYKPGEDRPPLFEWNLRNNHGYPVASGVYIYTISQGSRVLKKNKLMVIR